MKAIQKKLEASAMRQQDAGIQREAHRERSELESWRLNWHDSGVAPKIRREEQQGDGKRQDELVDSVIDRRCVAARYHTSVRKQKAHQGGHKGTTQLLPYPVPS